MIFISIFSAGIVSLLLELSLLREFVYIFGSTAASNAIIISTFLVGLAFGAHLGTWRQFDVKGEAEARKKFALIQVLSILFVVVFYLSKKYFIYHCQEPALVRAFFIFSVFAPSLMSGLSYALSVKIMHWRGERFITYIYAFSTLGSVIGGLAHGIILIPLWGIRSAYICSVLFAGIALYTMYPFMRHAWKALAALLVIGSIVAISLNISDMLFPSRNILFSKDSDFGLVEVFSLSDDEARDCHAALGGKEMDLRIVERPVIDIKVNNIHQAYNLRVDRNIHEQWAQTSLSLVNRPAKVLLLGYGSGVTAHAFVRSPAVERLDIVENCDPIVEAARIFFPKEYQFVMHSAKANMIVDDFRGYVRFADEQYDIIAMDHSIEDPYAIGFFTVEFFDQLKRITKPDGVVMMLGKGLSWNTTRLSFKYIYRNINPDTEAFLMTGCLWLSEEPFLDQAAGDYQLVTDGLIPDGVVYSDQWVGPLSAAERAEESGPDRPGRRL